MGKIFWYLFLKISFLLFIQNFLLYIEIWIEILWIFCILKIFIIGHVNIWASWVGPEIGWGWWSGGRVGNGLGWVATGTRFWKIAWRLLIPLSGLDSRAWRLVVIDVLTCAYIRALRPYIISTVSSTNFSSLAPPASWCWCAMMAQQIFSISSRLNSWMKQIGCFGQARVAAAQMLPGFFFVLNSPNDQSF